MSVIEAYADDACLDLLDGERLIVDGAIPSRVAEFATARRCARDALERLGRPRVPIRAGPHREPLWPTGVVGSITHCRGYRAAAVAGTLGTTIGIDGEPNEPLPPGVLEVVSRPAERLALTRLRAAEPAVSWDRLLFSAKEAVYKAWFPLVGAWLGFEDVELAFEAGTFAVEITPPSAGTSPWPERQVMTGRWSLDLERQLLVTYVRGSG